MRDKKQLEEIEKSLSFSSYYNRNKNKKPEKLENDAKQDTSEERNKLHEKLYENSIDEVDLENVGGKNVNKYEFRRKRNRVIIVTLAILLLLCIGGIVTFWFVDESGYNCFLNVYGANAEYFVDGDAINKFQAPPAITGNRVYNFKLDLKINEEGEFNIRFKIFIYQNGELLENTGIYEPNSNFRPTADGYYTSVTTISGGQTITLCYGAIIDDKYESILNYKNFKMEINTYLERA